MATLLAFVGLSLPTPLQAYIGREVAIIAEIADNGSDFELILTTTRKKWPS